MAEPDDLRPWDRQPGETSPAYEAFVTYRDMGYARSTAAVAQKLGKSKTLMDRWSAHHRWVSRVEAWDSLPGQAIQEAFSEMAQRIAAQHERVATKLMSRLEANLELMPQGADPSIKWSTAHGAARQGHALAADLSRPENEAKAEITSAIEKLINRLAGEED